MNDNTPSDRGILRPRRLVIAVLVVLFIGLIVFVSQSIFISADVLTVPDYNPAELKQRYQTTISASPSVTASGSPLAAVSPSPLVTP
ncbi:MAG TPA: hypothetical protein VGE59_00300 [Patescibacteria group bacterium]